MKLGITELAKGRMIRNPSWKRGTCKIYTKEEIKEKEAEIIAMVNKYIETKHNKKDGDK
jgi:hypothetical protein